MAVGAAGGDGPMHVPQLLGYIWIHRTDAAALHIGLCVGPMAGRGCEVSSILLQDGQVLTRPASSNLVLYTQYLSATKMHSNLAMSCRP